MPETLTDPAAVKDESFLGDFINSLPSLSNEPPQPEPDKEPDGTTRPNPADPVDKGKPADAPQPKPEPAAKPDAAKPEEGEDKQPTSQKDWTAYKAKRKGIEEQLRTELTTGQGRIKELETKLVEAETRVKAKPAADPEIKAQLEAANQQIEELHKAFMVTEVTHDPAFQKHFGGKFTTQIELAKKIVGPEQAAEVEKIINLPEGDYKNAQLEGLIGGLSDYQRSRLGGVLNQIDLIHEEKTAAIADAKGLKERESADRSAASAKAATVLAEKVELAIRVVADPEKGFSFFQHKEGDETWNAGVDKRRAAYRELLTAKDIPEHILARSAAFAVALPDVLKQWDADVKALVAERDTALAQVKKLSAAQPTAPKGGATQGEPRTRPDPRATPGDHLSRFVADAVKAAGG